MGLYSRVIFPLLCDFALDAPVLAKHRQDLLAGVEGSVLEIGFGTGLNLPHYPKHIRKITAVDPNPGMHARARRRIEQAGIAVEKHVLSGERLPVASGAFDCVVSTFTLCSIAKVDQALAEVYRVLRPGGTFVFLEHGLSSEPRVQKWQRRLNWIQRRLAGNCHLDRNIRQLVRQQPFGSIECREFYLEDTPKTHGYLYRGVATK